MVNVQYSDWMYIKIVVLDIDASRAIASVFDRAAICCPVNDFNWMNDYFKALFSGSLPLEGQA